MRYKLIIWDWNGTLIDDTWMCIEVINELLVKYSKQTLTLETYHKVFDFPVKTYYERIGFDFETKAGIFSLSYALGKQFDNPFEINTAKIHFGYISRF